MGDPRLIDPRAVLAEFDLTPQQRSRLDRLNQAMDGLDIAADLRDALTQLMRDAPAAMPTVAAAAVPSPTPGQLTVPAVAQPGVRPTGAAALGIPDVPHRHDGASTKRGDDLGKLPSGAAPRLTVPLGPDPAPDAQSDGGDPPDDREMDHSLWASMQAVPEPPDAHPTPDRVPPPPPPPSDPPARAPFVGQGHGPPPSPLHPPGPGGDPSRDPPSPSAPQLVVHLGPDPSTVVAGGAGHNVFAHGAPQIGPGGRPPSPSADDVAINAMIGRVHATVGPERRAAIGELVHRLLRTP